MSFVFQAGWKPGHLPWRSEDIRVSAAARSVNQAKVHDMGYQLLSIQWFG
jgi:hypothetical protein